MKSGGVPVRDWRVWMLALLALLPAVVTYLILWRTTTAIPYMDDYDAILGFANVYHRLPSLSARLLYINDATHVQYKLILLHSIVAFNVDVLHRIDFGLIEWLGNVSLLLIGWCLWRMFPHADIRQRLLFFLPVPLLVFVLRDNEAMGWAMDCLQLVAVVGYALLSLYLFCGKKLGWFVGGCIAFVLAAWSSANGLLVLPVALLVLWQAHAWRRIAALLLLTAVVMISYLHGFHPDLPTPNGHAASPLIIPAFYVALLGNVFSRWWLACPFGFVLLCFVVPVVWKAFVRDRRVDAVSASMLFLLLNAGLMTMGRYRFTLGGALPSRYSIYSQVLVALTYIAYIRPILARAPTGWSWLTLPRVYLASTTFALLLFVHYERVGARFSRERQAASIAHMGAWENYSHKSSLVALDEPEIQRNFAPWIPHASLVLEESMRQGIYVPPVLPRPAAPPQFFLRY
ncbi:MAG: hypothetical protein ACRYF4_12045 [Janthinobacterium lividum]